MKKKILSVLLFVLVLNTVAFGMVKFLPNDKLIERSELILLARVEKTENVPGTAGLHKNILRPLEILKGEYKESSITINSTSDEDSPEFPSSGKSVLLFLFREGNKGGEWQVVNRIQGFHLVHEDLIFGLENIGSLKELRKILQPRKDVSFNNWNIARVFSNPTKPTRFKLTQASHITLIENYHYNNKRSPGYMGFISEDGKEYGPCTAVGSPTVPPAALLWYWQCNPNVTLPPGTYKVIDSDPGTWSHNSESAGSGFSKIEGYSVNINSLNVKADEKNGAVPEKSKDGAEHKLSDSLTAKEYFERGIRAENYAQAIKEFTKALELDPVYAKAYFERGNIYLEKEKFNEAISDYNEYLALRPEDVFGYERRAVAYVYAGKFQKAIEDFDKVLKQYPKEARFYHSRGNCYELLGKEQEAIDDYKKAAKLGYPAAQGDLKRLGTAW